MATHTIIFISAEAKPKSVQVPTGTLLADAARQAGVEIGQPCGGQGRCGRCAVQVTQGNVRLRSTLRLSNEALEQGYALACQTIIEGDTTVLVPEQEKIERRLTTDRVAAEVRPPVGYDYPHSQSVRRIHLSLDPPSMDDQTDDWSRLQTALRAQVGFETSEISLPLLQSLPATLRAGEWRVTAILAIHPERPTASSARIITLQPGHIDEYSPLWGIAIDIGTTTVSLWLVDLISGKVHAQVAEYNGQIARGEDVISRIMFSSKANGAEEMRTRVLETINGLLDTACKRVQIDAGEIIKATVVGNSTMIHLLLGIPAENIRLTPFITTINQPPLLPAREVGLAIAPDACVDCLPGVASYVGADITAGVLASGQNRLEEVALFLDVGTNGEIVLGSRDWLVTCACSAGPAFEGAGVRNGMRATTGAIEDVWINSETYEPVFRVIGGGKPKGICGSGLIALLAEMFVAGILDKAGSVKRDLPTRRIREGNHGGEYVIAWADETETGEDIVLSRVDVDNLMRAKAAIYAGFSVLAEQVGFILEDVHKVLIGGSFGKYINVEKAVQIGLLPDIPWERFDFLGNTAVRGAYQALLDWRERERVKQIASQMTYIELSADNTFYEAFMSAMFLPHTDLGRFPSVSAVLNKST
ncbi:MAG: DUF4445 domain-containing protein [Anaerolineales bacterium]|nr:DUF4445 domain-containing protein [Anaerolineales bacterium]